MRYTFALAVFAVSLLTACNNRSALPTVAPTLPATVQATTAATVAAPTELPTLRPTRELPPTWTPTPQPTETPTPTEVLVTNTPFSPNAGLPPACSTFDIIQDQSTTNFQVGTSPTVTWKPVEGAIRYRVTLGDMNGRIVKDDIFIAETTFTFDPSFFKAESTVYTWSVYPINQAGDQMCFQVGGEMYPSLAPVN